MMEEVFIEVILDIPRERSLEVTPLFDHGIPEKMTGYFEVLYEEGLRSDRSILKLYFPAGYTAARWDVESLLLSTGLDDYGISENSVNRQNYMEAYKEHYEPIRLSEHFGVIPDWHRGTAKEQEFGAAFSGGLIPLYLDPGLAFGTGRHATTRMMVQFIDANNFDQQTVLDAGCGSGILALAALKKGARFATAFDIDGNAVNACRENLLENAIFPERFEVLEGGWDLPQIRGRQYDIIFANITMNIFVEYRRIIDGLKCDRLVVSGILEEAKDTFLQLFAESWDLHQQMTDDGWILLELHRKVH
jgi:ribosomal protein L11 methyltransferase